MIGNGRVYDGSRDGCDAVPSLYCFSRLTLNTGWRCMESGNFNSYAFEPTTRTTTNGPMYLNVNFGVRLTPTMRRCSVDSSTRSPTANVTCVGVDRRSVPVAAVRARCDHAPLPSPDEVAGCDPMQPDCCRRRVQRRRVAAESLDPS